MLWKILAQAKEALADPFSRFLLLAIAVAALYALAFSATVEPVAPQQFSGNATLDVHFFYLPSCPHCKEQMPYNQQIAQDYPSAKWIYHDTSDPVQNELMKSALSALGRNQEGVPTTIINRTVIVGFDKASTPQLLRTGPERTNPRRTRQSRCRLSAPSIPTNIPFRRLRSRLA